MITEIKTGSQNRRINRRNKIIGKTKELLEQFNSDGLALSDIALELDSTVSRVGNILSFYCKSNSDIFKTVIKKNGRWVSSYAMETDSLLYSCDLQDGNGEGNEP